MMPCHTQESPNSLGALATLAIDGLDVRVQLISFLGGPNGVNMVGVGHLDSEGANFHKAPGLVRVEGESTPSCVSRTRSTSLGVQGPLYLELCSYLECL